MSNIGYIGYIVYVIPLWLLTGFLMLQLDVSNYDSAKMNKEKKVARSLGWLNVALGLLLFVAYFAIRQWWY